MNTLDFEYSIRPVANPALIKEDAYPMKHMSETPKEQWTDAAENLFKFDDDKEGAESDFED